MAELLSREKELFKLNQQLNLMAADSTVAYPKYSGASSSMDKTATYVVTEPRFSTYHKQKGPSTLLKKKIVVANAADSYNLPESAANGTFSAKNHNRQRATLPMRHGQGHAHPVQSPVVAAKKEGSPTMLAAVPATTELLLPKSPVSQESAPPVAQLTKAKIPDWRRNDVIKGPPRFDSKHTTFSRGQQANKTATYVKYRNPNFRESPSLEDILRNAQAEEPQVEMENTKPRESTTVVNGNVKKQLTQDSFIKFLKAKVAILEEDHSRLSQDMANQREQLEKAVEGQRRADTLRDQALTSNKQLSEQLRKAEHQSEEAIRRNKEHQLDTCNQQREFEQVKRDMRILSQTNTNLENRLARALAEIEDLRQSMTKLRINHREEQDETRRELDGKEKRIKGLKRQRTDLLNAYKKQLFMIDNLKRQSSCIEQSVAIGIGEKEFNKVLDWNARI